MNKNIKYLVEEIQKFNPVEYQDNNIIDNDTVSNITDITPKNEDELEEIIARRLKENIEYPDFSGINTKRIKDMGDLFSEGVFNDINIDVSKIKRIDLSEWDTTNVTNMDYMFYGCSGLSEINLTGKFNTSKVESMQSMFGYCSSLTNIDLSNFDTFNVISMDSMFFDCKSLISLDLSHFNTQNVETFNSMFLECESLEFINLNGLDTSNASHFMGMFWNCKSLKKLDLSSFSLSPSKSISSMGSMFLNCESLEYLDLSGFDRFSNNRDYMCYLCKSLKDVKLSKEIIRDFIMLNNKNNLKIILQ